MRSSLPLHASHGPTIRGGSTPFAGLGEGHQSPSILVPQLEPHRAQAIPEGERRHMVKDRVLVVCALQVVVGDAST
jgi:hypothetical protein